MPHRFYVDEDLSDDFADALKGVGVDAVHAREVGHGGASDPTQLMVAFHEGRVLLTANAGHFRMLHEAWLVWSAGPGVQGLGPHPGIVVLPNESLISPVGFRDLIGRFERSIGAGDMRNRLFRYRMAIGWEDLSAARR